MTSTAEPRSAWWVRFFAALPMPVLYGLASFLTFLAFRVVRYRDAVVRENLRIAFPDLDAAATRALMHRYYAGYADVLVELVKSAGMSAEQVRSRVTICNLPVLTDLLQQGRPVLLMGAHQCNWEWMLLALSLQLGYPLDAAYKPLVDPWAEREMKILRTRFGARLVPAQELFADMLRRGKIVRAIAMIGDQEPVTSEKKHWLRFLNRDSAFFLGGEDVARTLRYAAVFIRLRRVARGRYEMEFVPLSTATETLAPGEFTERYAALVEAQIRSAPADWPWSHKRWRLKKPLYGG